MNSQPGIQNVINHVKLVEVEPVLTGFLWQRPNLCGGSTPPNLREPNKIYGLVGARGRADETLADSGDDYRPTSCPYVYFFVD